MSKPYNTALLDAFPSLGDFSSETLKDLLTDDRLLEAYLYTLPEVEAAAAEVERLGRENEQLAQHNMALQNELLAVRSTTASSYANAQHLKERWIDIERQQATIYQRYRPSFLHLRLRHSITSQDDLSESLAAAFIEASPDSPVGGLDSGRATPQGGATTDRSKNLDDFIKEFKATRKTYHKRAIWAERWNRGEVAWRDD